MATAKGIRGTALKSGSAILMARILDGAGVAIRRSDVIAIEYSAYELDPCWPEQLTAICGHRAIALAVDEVLFDSPQVGRLWSLDDVGYNFRHEIHFGWDRVFPKAALRYEMRYELVSVSGEKTIVRFMLRC
jgi:hypothetical protein